jgi:hypothetical protein
MPSTPNHPFPPHLTTTFLFEESWYIHFDDWLVPVVREAKDEEERGEKGVEKEQWNY